MSSQPTTQFAGLEGRDRGGPLVIVGASAIAEVAYEYFSHDSGYRVVAFAVEEAFLDRDEIFGLPVVPFEQVAERYDPGAHSMFVAIGYGQMNRVREDFVGRARHLGYPLASYVSSEAFVWPNVEIGEHCFLLEHIVVQPFVTIGDNVTLWSGNQSVTTRGSATTASSRRAFPCPGSLRSATIASSASTPRLRTTSQSGGTA